MTQGQILRGEKLVWIQRIPWITKADFFFHHTTCESTCDTLASPAANQGDNTVSVAQGGTSMAYYLHNAFVGRNRWIYPFF